MTKAESSKASSKPDPKLQTITLKVFVHCEGCRRKIRRIIRVLDGVEDVIVDSPAGKVTVTGVGIDPKIVIQRLQKYGKHAELWPGAKAGPSAVTESGGNQLKPAASSSPPGPDTTAKKKEKGAGEVGGTKPATPGKNEGKKGGGKKGEDTPVADPKNGKKGGETSESKQGSSESKVAEKSVSEDTKPTNVASKGEGSAAAPPQENGGCGGGKKGKKGGNGGNGQGNGSGGGGGGDGGGGGSVDHPRSLPPPLPRHIQDVPIAGLPATSTVMVSANRAPAPYDYIYTGYSESNPVEYATNMFSDENANNCSIM